MFRLLNLGTLLMLIAIPGPLVSAQSAPPAAQAFDRLKALEGEWIDVDGVIGPKGAVVSSYKVTSGGSAVIERFMLGSPAEITTVFHKDGSDLVLTHYCSADNQPRMRARTAASDAIAFEFDGGANIDPAKTSHMHSARFEFVSNDEIKALWQNWSKGQPDHLATIRLARRK
jgi:hypothetical protein